MTPWFNYPHYFIPVNKNAGIINYKERTNRTPTGTGWKGKGIWKKRWMVKTEKME